MIDEKILREVIDSFFKGVDFFEEPEIGHVWVARHGVKEYNRYDTQRARVTGLEPPGNEYI